MNSSHLDLVPSKPLSCRVKSSAVENTRQSLSSSSRPSLGSVRNFLWGRCHENSESLCPVRRFPQAVGQHAEELAVLEVPRTC